MITQIPKITDKQWNKTENYLIRKSYDDLNELMYFVRSNHKKEDFLDNFYKQIRYFYNFLQILYIRTCVKQSLSFKILKLKILQSIIQVDY